METTAPQEQTCCANDVDEYIPPEYGPGGVPKGSKTEQYYHTKSIPSRFNNPGSFNPGNPVYTCNPLETDKYIREAERASTVDWFEGYEKKPQHPMYRTTSACYGSQAPSVHTMPVEFYAKSQQFSKDLGKCGMYRNHSLNCASDKSIVPDH